MKKKVKAKKKILILTNKKVIMRKNQSYKTIK